MHARKQSILLVESPNCAFFWMSNDVWLQHCSRSALVQPLVAAIFLDIPKICAQVLRLCISSRSTSYHQLRRLSQNRRSAQKSRFRWASSRLSSCYFSESNQSSGSVGYSMELLVFRMSSYGSIQASSSDRDKVRCVWPRIHARASNSWLSK